MQLYYAPNSISVATAIALEEAGQSYTATPIDFAQGAQLRPGYLEINPKGRVPALETSGGILTETGALLEYVAPALMPTDRLQAAKVRSVMYYIASTMHVNHAHGRRGSRWADRADSMADMQAKVPETMAASATYIETHCLAGPFVLGPSLSTADPYLFAVCSWLPGDGVPFAGFPRIAAFMAAMEARPSVKAVREKGILT